MDTQTLHLYVIVEHLIQHKTINMQLQHLPLSWKDYDKRFVPIQPHEHHRCWSIKEGLKLCSKGLWLSFGACTHAEAAITVIQFLIPEGIIDSEHKH